MPVTRSKGRAPETWKRDTDAGASTSTPVLRHQTQPRSPSTSDNAPPPPPPLSPRPARGGTPPVTMHAATEEGSSDTVRPSQQTRSRTASQEGGAAEEQDRRSATTSRSKRKVLKAREEMLKIKLQLAQLALQRAQEEDSDSDYEEDGHSKIEYVKSWLEEAPEPLFRMAHSIENDEEPTRKGIRPQNRIEHDEGPARKGIRPQNRIEHDEGPTRKGIHPQNRIEQDEAPPRKDIHPQNRIEQDEAPPRKDIHQQNRIENSTEDEAPQKKETHHQGGDLMTPLITGLTSAIAALADRKPLDTSIVSPHPAVSKVIMTLPTFSGAHTEWLSFRALYDTTRRYFNDIENTARLRRSLKGRALEAVSSELIGNARPDEIMKELELQFGRPDSIAQAETDKLKTLPRCTEAPKDICAFASKIRSSVITLQALKKEHYLVNPELLRVLTEKLPNSLRVTWYRTYTEKYESLPDLSRFSEFVTEYARFCSAFAPAENISEQQPTRRTVQRTHTATEKRTSDRASSQKCRVCERDGHHASECNAFKSADVNRRWELAKTHRLCFGCLRPRYMGHICKSKKCNIGECTARHHHLLHYEKRNVQGEAKQEIVASSSVCEKTQAFLKIVPVHVVGPAGEASTFALLDDGSTVSLIDEDIAKEIGAEGTSDPLTIRTIGDTAMVISSARRINVTLKSTENRETPLCARTYPGLNLLPQTVSERDLLDCKHLEDIKEKLVYNTGVPKILIGQDNWHLLVASATRRGPSHQPVASLTPLGWVLHGTSTRTLGHTVHFVNQMSSVNENIDAQLKEHFALESLMITPRRPRSDPEKQAEDILEKHTKQIENGHIETALLWKKEEFEMPDSYEIAINRLTSIEKKLDRNVELKKKYIEQMNLLIEKGYAEEAPSYRTPGRTWYLPHFDVYNPSKPEKLRIVHDAAARTKGASLNDYLLTGPDLLQSLPGVLMRFRRHRVAVSADIAEMFMQVQVRTEDRDALRYLWRGDRREGPPTEYRMKSLIFGAASSPCTAIFAKNWNARKHACLHPEAAEAIIENHYMDDYLDSFRDEHEAARIATEVRDIHRKACFELRRWVSNSVEVIEKLQPSSSPIETVSLASDRSEEKILGLMWNPSTDELSFNLKLARLPCNLLEKETPTKREALRIVMSLYDPLGLASPITIRAKQILQEAWRLGTDWDDKLNEDLSQQWTSWKRQLQQLKTVSIPRCYPGYSDAASIQVHVFTDASETAYATAVYWRTTTPDGRVYVTLVSAKARVAPLKIVSIPRLELQAAVLGTRVVSSVIQEHRIKPEAVIYWTDSRTVLSWIRKGSRSYKPFVAHRLAEIEEHSKVEQWRWVPTKCNSSDIATRGILLTFSQALSKQLDEWYYGPAFLYEDPSLWPAEKTNICTDTGEERTTTVIDSYSETQKVSEVIPDVNRFSKWERLLRTTARVLQFIELCKKTKKQVLYKRTQKNTLEDPDWRRVQQKQKNKSAPGDTSRLAADSTKYVLLTAEHTRGAEDLLVKAVQEASFSADLRELRRGGSGARGSRLSVLPIELNNGVITLRSRIAAVRDITEKTKRPPVLDGDHRIVQLYIDWTHRSLHHSGTELVINEIRQHYWILRLRPTTKKIVHQCLQCKIRKAIPPQPSTGDHPKARLAHHQRPFTFTGLDYFGPLFVTVGRQHQKRYVALFTCLTSRAVHLEVAANLSADSAILALRRFAARRGCPSEIYSDNGTNMHGADKEMREAVQHEAGRRGIAWRFITPSAPFMGGAWERLVRCVKTTLYTVLHDKYPHEEVLATLLCEVEYTVNSRPLTHVSVDVGDTEAITPNHILFGGSARLPSLGEFSETDSISKKHWRRAQYLADEFWRRWVREYLPELQNRREPHGKGPLFEVGDPVLIADGQLPRNTWPRGRIVAVYPGADGQIRTAEVRTSAGVLKRPTKKLVPLPK